MGIIGCGQISRYHLQAVAEDGRARCVAACDLRPEAVVERAAEFDIPGRYTRVEDLLNDPAVEAVIVATGPEAHLGPTVAAFAAGKHVLVEKPVAVTAAEVEAMLAARGDLVGACCSSRFRSTEGARVAGELLAAGELGAVRRLSADILQPPSAGYDGTSPFFLHRPGWGGQGVLADWGCYDLDYLLGLCGWRHEPRVVLGEMTGLPQFFRQIAQPANDVEVRVSAQAWLSGGVVLDYQRAMFAAVDEARQQWRIECENGAVDLNMLPAAPQLKVHRYQADGVRTEALVPTPYQWSDIHRGPVANFIDAVLGDATPRTTLENALTVQRLTDAICHAARTGTAVTLPATASA